MDDLNNKYSISSIFNPSPSGGAQASSQQRQLWQPHADPTQFAGQNAGLVEDFYKTLLGREPESQSVVDLWNNDIAAKGVQGALQDFEAEPEAGMYRGAHPNDFSGSTPYLPQSAPPSAAPSATAPSTQQPGQYPGQGAPPPDVNQMTNDWYNQLSGSFNQWAQNNPYANPYYNPAGANNPYAQQGAGSPQGDWQQALNQFMQQWQQALPPQVRDALSAHLNQDSSQGYRQLPQQSFNARPGTGRGGWMDTGMGMATRPGDVAPPAASAAAGSDLRLGAATGAPPTGIPVGQAGQVGQVGASSNALPDFMNPANLPVGIQAFGTPNGQSPVAPSAQALREMSPSDKGALSSYWQDVKGVQPDDMMQIAKDEAPTAGAAVPTQFQ